jgi:hypothetical protein
VRDHVSHQYRTKDIKYKQNVINYYAVYVDR